MGNRLPCRGFLLSLIHIFSHNSNYSIADKEMSYIVSSKALAMTVVDLLCDGAREALRVKEEFRPIMTKEQYLREWGQLQ